MRYFPGTPALQVVRSPNVWSRRRVDEQEVLVASAAEALGHFV